MLINGSPLEAFDAQRGLRQGDPMSPLLFVLGMEYLSRILTHASLTGPFSYHPRHKSTKLTHLCFTDELMLFCRANAISLSVMAKCTKRFSQSSGLIANTFKFTIYNAGVSQEMKL